MDAPLAPKLCGGVIGRALVAGLLSGSALVDLCKPIEGGETRRALVAPALQYIKVCSLIVAPTLQYIKVCLFHMAHSLQYIEVSFGFDYSPCTLIHNKLGLLIICGLFTPIPHGLFVI